MIRILLIALVMPMTLMSCNGQTKNSEKELKDNVPHKNIVVNKEYDENGNLIRFDSTYSYYYSNTNKDSTLRDSIFDNFTDHFNQSYSFSNHPFFKDFFFQDSLLMYDFYKKDFFYERFRNNMERMDSLFREMDILKNDFFRKQTIPIIK
jgi:hypothetical protein